MKRRIVIAASLLALLGLSVGGYAASTLAVAPFNATVTNCNSKTGQLHTDILDTDTRVFGGDVVTVCATATAPDPVTTTVGTTTSPTTTTIPPSNSYEQAISYTNTRPAFTPTRTVNVTTAAALKTAISTLQPGDLIKATTPFTVTSASGPALTISARPSSTAEIDLTGVTFVYNGGQNENGVFIGNAANLNIFGGTITTSSTGGVCLRDYGSQHVLWWGWSVHDCGSTGFQPQSVNAAVTNNDFQGTITNVGQNLAYDPHSEKGTGLHGANLWDNVGTFTFANNRFALDEHDIAVGACVEFGNDTGTAPGNTLYLRCVNETDVSHVMTGGNGIQFWGGAMGSAGLDIKYIECQNLQGACVYSIANSSGVTVEYGRASHTNQNPQVTGGIWNKTRGIVYQDVIPAP